MANALSQEQRARIAELGEWYHRYLTEDILPLWTSRTADDKNGGYIHCFTRDWRLYDDEKYIWFQGRQFYMFSKMLSVTGQREPWLSLARRGRDFLLRDSKAYAGNGRFNYQLDPTGQTVRKGTISGGTDFFVLQGLAQYMLATGDLTDMPVLLETWEVYKKNVLDPEFKDVFHSVYDPMFTEHGHVMSAVFLSVIMGELLGVEAVREFAEKCARRVLFFFAKDEYKVLFENLARDGSVVREGKGTIVNPGHTIESMWFCLQAGKMLGSPEIVERALTVGGWDWERGWDAENGGFYNYINAFGGEAYQAAWHKETNTLSTDRNWWAHAEALAASAQFLAETGDPVWYERFIAMHEYTQRYFADHEYGEWYSVLNADGSVKDDNKGSLWKAAYHLPRALLYTYQALESME